MKKINDIFFFYFFFWYTFHKLKSINTKYAKQLLLAQQVKMTS